MCPRVRENIVQKVVWCDPSDKFSFLTNLLNVPQETTNNVLVLVLVQSSERANDLIGALKQAESAGGLTVSYPVFVRTVDNIHNVPDVRHLIFFDVPTNIDEYLKSVNCTTRKDLQCLVTSFFCEENLDLALDMADLLVHCQQEVPSWLNNLVAEMRYSKNNQECHSCCLDVPESQQPTTRQDVAVKMQCSSPVATHDQSVQVDDEDSTRAKLFYHYSQVIRQRDSELASAQEEIKYLHSVICQKDAEVEEARCQLQQHSFLLAQKDTEICRLNFQLNQMARLHQALCQFIQHLETDVHSLKQELGAAHHYHADVQGLQSRVDELQRQNQFLETKLVRAEEELHTQACKFTSEMHHLNVRHSKDTNLLQAAQQMFFTAREEANATISELQTTYDQLAIKLLASTAAAQFSSAQVESPTPVSALAGFASNVSFPTTYARPP